MIALILVLVPIAALVWFGVHRHVAKGDGADEQCWRDGDGIGGGGW